MDEEGGVFPAGSAVPVVREGKAVPVQKLLGRIKKLTTESIRAGSAASYEAFMRAGSVQSAARMMREIDGGFCPICKRAYVKTKTQNSFADFEWFKPECSCEDTEEEKKSRVAMARGALVLSGVPEEYLDSTFETWDYGAEPSINSAMKEVYGYAKERGFVHRGLVLYGDVGTGKTRCGVSVLRRAAADGLSVQFVKMAEIVGRFADRERGKRFVDSLLARDVVLFDDLDKIGNMENAWVAEQVFRVFDGLMTSRRRIVATSNLGDPGAFMAKFGEAVMSRLLGNCQFIEFKGADYRQRRAEMERKNREQAPKEGEKDANKKVS